MGGPKKKPHLVSFVQTVGTWRLPLRWCAPLADRCRCNSDVKGSRRESLIRQPEAKRGLKAAQPFPQPFLSFDQRAGLLSFGASQFGGCVFFGGLGPRQKSCAVSTNSCKDSLGQSPCLAQAWEDIGTDPQLYITLTAAVPHLALQSPVQSRLTGFSPTKVSGAEADTKRAMTNKSCAGFGGLKEH